MSASQSGPSRWSTRETCPVIISSLCSPDGKWKAASETVKLDAGADNTFGNITASCIAGPCPFTRIDSSGFIHGGRNISVTALNWSDTATFLMEAEVYHTAINSEVRELYPVKFGQTLNFTLPPTQEGVSLEAEVDGAPMVFPLGPNLSLSWATCNVRTGPEQEKTTVYRCELKPGLPVLTGPPASRRLLQVVEKVIGEEMEGGCGL